MNKLLLLGVFFALWLDSVLGVELGLVPGLSAKNVMLYIAVVYIALQAVLDSSEGGLLKRRQVYMPMHFAFIGLILMALISAVVCILMMDYRGYSLSYAIISIKGYAIDHYLMLFVFLVGVRTGDEAMQIARVILIAMAVGALIWILDLFGLVDFGIMEPHPDSGRIIGPMGEANQTGTLMAFYAPIMFAFGLVSRRSARAFWWASGIACLVMLLSSGSRGAFSALMGASMVGAWFIRDKIRFRHTLTVAAAALVLAVASYLLLPDEYGKVLYERFVGMGAERTIWDQSSGRTGLWGNALGQMGSAPLSLLLGFGWKTYNLMNPLASHNEYLEFFFNLGVIGLLVALLAYLSIVWYVRRSLEIVTLERRTILTGFLFGYVSILIAIFFVNLHDPWLFVWSFTGLMLRLASGSNVTQRAVTRKGVH